MMSEDDEDDDDDDGEGDEKSDGDSENEDTVQANMDEDMDQFRLPGLEECEKEGENYLLFNHQIEEVLVTTLFFNPPSRHPATRPEDDSSKNKGQRRCPLQLLN